MRYLSPTRLLLVICSIVIAGCAEKVSFSADVMPILAENCLDCHQEGGAGYAASGFSVASYDDVMKGTRNGPVVEAGYSYASTLQVLVQHGADPSIAMPQQARKLRPGEIQVIGDWIDQGALNN
jgi:hypothetical protein